ncbi:MAG: response regulator [Deltaproteobacteria bacterium]|jgi:signal transduction histidine kinase/HPt (histidine-containing phosphotransfer) domain-containing protein/ActR/RegA family two-component response regulator|nr:response regulator [Deltaproteobacteria bacterium]
MSLKTAIKNDIKLIILVIMAFLIMSLSSYFLMSRVVRRQIELLSQTEMQVYRYSLTSLSRACDMALLHASQVMAMAMDRGVKDEGYLDLVRRLTDAYENQGDLLNFFSSVFCYLDGYYVDSDGIEKVPEAEMEAQPWYAGTLSGRGPSEINDSRYFFRGAPRVDAETGESVLSLSKPIADGNGTIRGAIGMEFLLDPVIDRVESLKPEVGGVFALMADSSLRVVAHPDEAENGKPLSGIDGLKDLVPRLPATSDDMLITRTRMFGKPYVAIFSRLENDWMLGIFSPVSSYYQEAYRTFPVVIGLSLLLATTLVVVLMRLSHAKQRSEEANRLKTDSLARISHELRTPLNAIIGLSDMARRNPSDPRVPSYLGDISRAGGSLLNLVNEILDFSKMESGKVTLSESPYRTGRLLGDVLALIAVRLKEKPTLVFMSQIDPYLPSVLLGDERSVKQVLLNILVNAVKYTHKGHIKFTAGFESLDESFVELAFTVEDTGVGIRDEDLGHLFDDFVRLDRRSNQKVEGTGLGLSIALNLCRLMGGDITVESVFGQGSRFTATCRQAVMDPRPLGQLPPQADPAGEDQAIPFLAPGLKVLIVDDVLTNLTVAKGLLEPYRMDVTTALSGQEAVDLARATPFDLLFVDQMMPGLDGVETLKLLRAISGHYLKAPIISLTANAVAGARESLLAQGFDDYLSKPIDNQALVTLLGRWVPDTARRPVPAPSGPAPAPAPADGFLAALGFPGFEPQEGLRRSGGSLGKYAELLDAFLLDAGNLKDLLVRPKGPGDLPGLAISVHALKGASANVGAARLSGLAADLEGAAKRGDLAPFGRGDLEVLAGELADVAQRVTSALRLARDQAGPFDRTGKKPPGAALNRLKKALRERDVGLADRLIGELSPGCDGESRAILAAASDQILIADYGEAIKLIDRISSGSANV